MIKLSEVVPAIVSGDPFLQYGLQYRLFNLTKLASHLRPMVEERAKKTDRASAILMALSRLQRSMKKISKGPGDFRVSNIAVHTGLGTFAFDKSEDVLRRVHRLHTEVLRKNGYITITEGTAEVTVIMDTAYASLIRKLLRRSAKSENTRVSALGIHFPARYAEVPGFLCIILQQIMLQGINVVEVASTFTEFVLYIDEANTKLAFDTIYHLFDVKMP